MLLLFVLLLDGAIETGEVAQVDHLLPGILLTAVASGPACTAYRLLLDRSGGTVDRFGSMPIARSAVLSRTCRPGRGRGSCGGSPVTSRRVDDASGCA